LYAAITDYMQYYEFTTLFFMPETATVKLHVNPINPLFKLLIALQNGVGVYL